MGVRILNKLHDDGVTRLLIDAGGKPVEVVVAPFHDQEGTFRGYRFGLHLVGAVYADESTAQSAGFRAAELLVEDIRMVRVPVIGKITA